VLRPTIQHRTVQPRDGHLAPPTEPTESRGSRPSIPTHNYTIFPIPWQLQSMSCNYCCCWYYYSCHHRRLYVISRCFMYNCCRESWGRVHLTLSAGNYSSYVGAYNEMFLTREILHFTYYFRHVSIARNNDTVYIVAIRVLDELANHSRTLNTHSGKFLNFQIWNLRFLHHCCHHQSFLLSFTPGSNSSFTNPFLLPFSHRTDSTDSSSY